MASVDPIGPDIEVRVGFNTTAAAPLNDTAGADASKWSVRFSGRRYSGLLVSKENFDRLYLQMLELAAEPGPDEISYAGPSDISDSLGRWLAPFAGMPL